MDSEIDKIRCLWHQHCFSNPFTPYGIDDGDDFKLDDLCCPRTSHSRDFKNAQRNLSSLQGQMVSNPTARWVFQFFTGIHVLVVGVTREIVLNLNKYQAALLKLLGEPYEALYSGSG